MIKHHKASTETVPGVKIKTGKKSEKGLPMGLSYFHFAVDPTKPFAEENVALLKKMYGEEPQSLFIELQTNDIEGAFDDRYVLWAGGNRPGKDPIKARYCDQETCTHVLAEQFGDVQYAAGSESECVCARFGLAGSEDEKLRKRACKYEGHLRALIVDPTARKVIIPTPFLFETHSYNSGCAIHAAIDKLAGLTAKLADGIARVQYIPMVLSVKMVQSSVDPRQKYPIWSLSLLVNSVPQLIDLMIRVADQFGWPESAKKALLARKNEMALGAAPVAAQLQAATEPSTAPPTNDGEPDPDNPLGIPD